MVLLSIIFVCIGLARLATGTKASEIIFGVFLITVGVVGITVWT